MKLETLSRLALAGLLCLAASHRVSTAPLYFDFNQVGAADIVTLSYPAAGLNGGEYYAGQYQVESSPNPDFSAATSFNTFCVDLFDDVNIGQQYLVNPRSTNDGLTNGAEIAYLYNAYGINAISTSGRRPTPMAAAATRLPTTIMQPLCNWPFGTNWRTMGKPPARRRFSNTAM